jgi:hypothetical protein
VIGLAATLDELVVAFATERPDVPSSGTPADNQPEWHMPFGG